MRELVFMNGVYVEAADARVSVQDRGFLYGDGLFETVRVFRGRLFRWPQHWRRFFAGAQLLKIRLPLGEAEMAAVAEELAERNQVSDGVAKVVLTRGTGPRGYSPLGAQNPTLVISTHAATAPDGSNTGIKLAVASLRLAAAGPLAMAKHCSKLLHVMARAEADEAGADDALLLNAAGEAVETSSGNLFWCRGDEVLTAPLEAGVLPGITREVVLEICRAQRIAVREQGGSVAGLCQADGVFVTQAARGIAEVSQIQGQAIRRSPVAGRVRTVYEALLVTECGGGA